MIEVRRIKKNVLIETQHRFIYIPLEDVDELVRLLEEIT